MLGLSGEGRNSTENTTRRSNAGNGPGNSFAGYGFWVAILITGLGVLYALSGFVGGFVGGFVACLALACLALLTFGGSSTMPTMPTMPTISFTISFNGQGMLLDSPRVQPPEEGSRSHSNHFSPAISEDSSTMQPNHLNTMPVNPHDNNTVSNNRVEENKSSRRGKEKHRGCWTRGRTSA